MANIEFTQEEFSELIYAAREAGIRFQRARTEMRQANPRYLHWFEPYLNEQICHYADMEGHLCNKFKGAFGSEW